MKKKKSYTKKEKNIFIEQLEDLLYEEECNSCGYYGESDEEDENETRCAALKWAINICKQNIK